MSQGGLFTPAGKGTATLLRTLPSDEGRVYHLDPPLTQPVQTSHVMLTGTSITYAQAWNAEHGAGIYVGAPTQGNDAQALERLGYRKEATSG